MDLSDAEKNDIISMRNTPHLYNKMVESVCPSVFGHLDVKRGVLLMLFGGVQKSTPEGPSSLFYPATSYITLATSCVSPSFILYPHLHPHPSPLTSVYHIPPDDDQAFLSEGISFITPLLLYPHSLPHTSIPFHLYLSYIPL